CVLHPVVYSGLLHEVRHGQAVHHRAEHAHVVGTGAVQAVLGQFGAAEEVASADHHCHFDAVVGGRGDLGGDLGHHVRVQAHRSAAEDLTGEFQQDTTVLLWLSAAHLHPPVGGTWLRWWYVTPARRSGVP